VAADCVDELGALADEEISHAMQHQRRLLPSDFLPAQTASTVE
jgi:hypothetical protein